MARLIPNTVKTQALNYAEDHGLKAAATRFNVSVGSLVGWRRLEKLKREKELKTQNDVQVKVHEPEVHHEGDRDIEMDHLRRENKVLKGMLREMMSTYLV